MSLMKLKIVNNDFTTLMDIKSSHKISNLKENIVNMELFHQNFGDCDIKRCNLFHIRTCQNLEDQYTVEFYKLENGDEILLSRPSKYLHNSDNSESIELKISEKDIEEATKDLAVKNLDVKKEKSREESELLLRKVLITLIEVAQDILCLNRTASGLFQFVYKEIESSKKLENIQADKNLINTLLEMGISRDSAENALINNNNSLNAALNYLFTESSPEQSHDISSNRDSIEIQWIKDLNEERFIKPMPAPVILKLYREYNRKFFRPLVAVREKLIDMGFEESTVNEALRLNNNNEMAAVESLLSPSSLIAFSEDDLVLDGISLDSDIMKALLSDAEIQLGLMNIYSLLAFLNIVDNPKNLPHWLANPETKIVLQQITNIASDFTCVVD